NSISNLLKFSKKKYYTNFFSHNINSIKNTWKGIKELINVKRNKNSSITSILINNKCETDPKSMSNHFNNFFTTIASKLSNGIPISKFNYKEYLTNPISNSFYMQPITKEETLNYINSTIIEGRSVGPNSLPTKLFKLVSGTLCKPLSIILNNSFCNGTFPDAFKLAQIIPIHKNGSTIDCTNYRPISLLSNVSKIFEKVMHNKLFNFLNQNQCLYKHQFGFRKRYSTAHALIKITESIRVALDSGNFACGVFVDFQKAFDTVDHEILLSKLNYYGVRGISLQWFKSYLSDRQQFVTLNGISSDIKKVSIGIPQGSILGPLLFIIYINDLNLSIKHSKTYHFADDTNLQLITNSLKKLNKYINQDMASLVQWLRANKISLNTKKTEIIVFKTRKTNFLKKNKKNIPKYLNFRISGQKLSLSSNITYLGVVLDEKLSFKTHISDLTLKLSRSIGMLAKVRHYVNFETLLSIYHSIFGSHLRYACQVWGQSKTVCLSRIVSLQNRAVRIIHFCPRYFSTDILYLTSKILRFYDLIQFLNCSFVWDQQHGVLSTIFHNYFNNRTACGHNLRSVTYNNLTIPLKQTSKHGINSITYQCILSWNSLPNTLKSGPNLRFKNLFLKSLHHFYLNSYA
ncbi:MAG: reverse transcriptase family protein, partial [Rickettsiales bacterium]|nr:reverse transcriptase family protein [Rickettsiales bacterium]